MKQALTLITLGVSDLGISARFYEETLGWKRSRLSQGDVIVFDVGGIALALHPLRVLASDARVKMLAKPGDFRGFTLSHNVSSQHEADTLFARLQDANVTIRKLPERTAWGGYSGYIADPDGNLIEICHNPFWKLNKDGQFEF